jgi:2-(1,2-epoxy-1,2-dihydrophenyl)acetyl-CoA isomerase
MDEAGSPVLLEIEQAVAVITLNRPRVLNALDAQMAQGLAHAFERVAEDGTARALLLRGAGRAFCAGGDVARFLDGDPAEAVAAILDPFHAGLKALAKLGIPTIAAVHGAVAGGGLSLALACDLCIASEDAIFTTAYARIGASPDGSLTYALPRIVGPRKALELAMLAEPIRAAEALRLGLVARVAASDTLQAEAAAFARKMSEGPTAAYARIRALIDGSLAHDLPTQLDREREALLAGTRTADFVEGVSAFLAKRPARFEGR